MMDWYRLARPQADGYDTGVVAEIAAREYGFAKHEVGPHGWLDDSVTLLNEGIALPGPGLTWAPYEHASLVLGESYFRAWPECFAQAKALLQTVFIFDWPEGHGARGCFCGTSPRLPGKGDREDGSPFGEIFSTVFDPVGFIEGIVHEMAHWKLHALGVHFEKWDGTLLLNDPSELFVSSIRKDKNRPMGAVLHAHWVCLHILAVDLVAGVARRACSTCRRKDDDERVVYSAGRVREGQASVAAGARWTEAGLEFWRGLQDWTTEMLKGADEIAAQLKQDDE